MSEPLDLDKLRAKTDDTIENYEDFPPVNDWELEAQRSALIARALLQRVADAERARNDEYVKGLEVGRELEQARTTIGKYRELVGDTDAMVTLQRAWKARDDALARAEELARPRCDANQEHIMPDRLAQYADLERAARAAEDALTDLIWIVRDNPKKEPHLPDPRRLVLVGGKEAHEKLTAALRALGGDTE